MSEIVTRRIGRAQLSSVFKTHELVKLVENLVLDVTETLPGMTTLIADKVQALELGVFGSPDQPQRDVRRSDFITIEQDAAGYIVGLDIGQVALAMEAYLPPPRQPDDVRAGDFVTITRNAAGYTVGVDMGQLMLAISAFAQPATPATMPPDDSQAVLAAQIFRS